jgi:hypothetical protein
MSALCIDLAHQMVRGHHLGKIEDVEELPLSRFLSSLHRSIPVVTNPTKRNCGISGSSIGVLQHNQRESGHDADWLSLPSLTRNRHWP